MKILIGVCVFVILGSIAAAWFFSGDSHNDDSGDY
jgi:hypothetical protein